MRSWRREERSYEGTVGSPYLWGRGSCIGLGHDDTNKPQTVLLLYSLDVKHVAPGNGAGAAILQDGSVVTWATPNDGKVGHTVDHCASVLPAFAGLTFRMVRMGCSFTLFLEQSGEVWACGSNQEGCLTNAVSAPMITSPERILEGFSVLFIEAGPRHCGVILEDGGNVLTWGSGEVGQLGHAVLEEGAVTQPRVVEELRDRPCTMLAFGHWHSLALTVDGRVYAWGDSSFGQLGIGKREEEEARLFSAVPVLVPSLCGISWIAAGQSHSGAVTIDGRLFVWGAGNQGQLGNGSKRSSFVPVQITRIFTAALDSSSPLRQSFDIDETCGFSQLACGSNHCLALLEFRDSRKSNKLLAWGAGTHGRLGLESEFDAAAPQECVFFSKKDVREIRACGEMSCCVISRLWIGGDEDSSCGKCHREFTTFRRKHFCRHCGSVFCLRCTSNKIAIREFGYNEPTRVYVCLDSRSL